MALDTAFEMGRCEIIFLTGAGGIEKACQTKDTRHDRTIAGNSPNHSNLDILHDLRSKVVQ